MKKKILCCLLLLLFAFSISSCSIGNAYDKNYIYFDTYITLKIYSHSESKANEIFAEVDKTLYLYQNVCDRYQEESDGYVGCFTANKKAGEEVVVNKELIEVIKFANDTASNLTSADGTPYFTVAVGKISDLWHSYFKEYNEAGTCPVDSNTEIPSEEDLSKIYDTDASKIIINEEKSTIKIPSDMSLDLGGVVKGYVAKILEQYFEENNIKFLINLGSSNVSTNIGNPKRKNNVLSIGITNPAYTSTCNKDVPQTFGTYNLPVGYSFVTSGDYQQYYTYKGVRYSHIMDPKTNRPVKTDIRSVSIILKDPGMGDVYSTSLFIMGVEKAYEFVEKTEGLEAIFYTTNNEIYCTSGIKTSFVINEGFNLKNFNE